MINAIMKGHMPDLGLLKSQLDFFSTSHLRALKWIELFEMTIFSFLPGNDC